MTTHQAIQSEPDAAVPDNTEVRTYLKKLLGRSELNLSERNRRFLAYVVDETLAGRADRLKAYSIALAAFGRSDDFDPLTDPIVRIEARRLRRALEHYYLTAGKDDAIRIDVPKGSYVAAFSYAHEQEAIGTDVSSRIDSRPAATGIHTWFPQWPSRRSLVMSLAIATCTLALLFVSASLWTRAQPGLTGGAVAVADSAVIFVVPAQYSGDDADSFIADSLTRELVVGLMAVDDVVVMAPHLGADGARQVENLNSYVLAGTIYQEADKLRLIVTLSDARSGRYVWSWTLRGDLEKSDLLSIQAQMAAQVVGTFKHLCGSASGAAAHRAGQGASCNLATLVASR